MRHIHPELHRGFTLIEMIIVIVITGIIAGMVAIFIRAPVQGYVDSGRRAEMTDIADTALRRIGRDLRTAVPNSVRIPASADSYFEFLPTKAGGRYRVDRTNGAGGCAGVAGNTLGDALNFDAADTCFEIVGSSITFATGDYIVVGSTQSNGAPAYDQTSSLNASGVAVGGVLRAYTGGDGDKTFVTMAGAARLPAAAELDGHRFEVVPADQQAVTYACLGLGTDAASGDGTGTLTRFWKYNFYTSQKAPAALAILGSISILASKVSDCHFVYDTSNQRNSLLAVRLRITRGGESVNLYHEIHVNNIP
jgi:MSHA biogenesis protein MshO